MKKICLFVLVLIITHSRIQAQRSTQMVRLAKIEVDPNQLNAYKRALTEQMHAAVQKEPGVLTYYAVAEKTAPHLITILEIYADSSAYLSHIQTAHFLHYKNTVKDMVKSLTLLDVDLIGVARKPDLIPTGNQ
jgi:quinol monooxygenase YgiN